MYFNSWLVNNKKRLQNEHKTTELTLMQLPSTHAVYSNIKTRAAETHSICK